jgi:ABC-2 type transport system ATP-binding protein
MIEVSDLHKHFGTKKAVDGISFTVGRGEVLGFLGPNGAGKSTTMRVITGFLPATSGSVKIGGHSVADQSIAAKALVGYLPENAPSYTDMDVEHFLRFAAEVRGMRGEAAEEAVARAVKTCFLEPVLFQSIDTLSKGYRHRVGLAQAMVHDPEVLILDEPTDGLDPNQKHEVRSLIRRMSATKTIIFSTHILEEVEAVCTRAIIIDRGKIVASGTPAELKAKSKNAGRIFVRLAGGDLAAFAGLCASMPGCASAESVEDSRLVLVVPAENVATAKLFREIATLSDKHKYEVEEIRIDEGRLDEVFREITTGDTNA